MWQPFFVCDKDEAADKAVVIQVLGELKYAFVKYWCKGVWVYDYFYF